jgi:hypothetical protein
MNNLAHTQRCSNNKCLKKLKLMTFKCKCGKTVCRPAHLHPPEDHECEYDFKGIGRELLKTTMIKVGCDKIIKI